MNVWCAIVNWIISWQTFYVEYLGKGVVFWPGGYVRRFLFGRQYFYGVWNSILYSYGTFLEIVLYAETVA